MSVKDITLPTESAQPLHQRIERGLLEYSAQQFLDAKETFAALTRDYPYMGKLWMYLGNVEYRLRAYLLAEKSWKEGLALDPMAVDGYLNLGSLLVEQQRYDEAIYLWRTGLSIDEKHKALCLNLANLYRKLKRPCKAFQLYQKFQEIAGHRDTESQRIQRRMTQGYGAYKPNIQIAHLALKQNNLDHARRAYDKALEYYIGTAKDYKTYGNVLYKLDRLDEAAEAYWNAIELNENDGAVYVNLGIILEKQKKLIEAIWAYTKGLQLSEGNDAVEAKLRPRIGRLVVEIGESIGFQAYLEKARKSREQFLLEDAKNRLVRLLDLLPHTQAVQAEVEAEMRAMAELFEVKSTAKHQFYTRGEQYLEAEEDEAALYFFQLFVQYFPDDAIADELKGICEALEERIEAKKLAALEEQVKKTSSIKRW